MENLSAVPDVQSQNAGALIINASDMSKKIYRYNMTL